jgi:hypothetical protein
VLTDLLNQDGGDLVNAECPAGKYLVGFSGSLRPNEWMTRIDIACGRWNGSSFVDVTSAMAFGPGGGGSYSTGGCSSASTVLSVVVSIHAPNGNVRRLDATCWNTFDIGDASFIVGITTPPPGITLGAAGCPVTHRAAGVRGRVNPDGVDGFGLMCRPKP